MSSAWEAGAQLHDRLPARPGPESDRLLDALERCIARFGLRHTSMAQLAREMGVSRATLYRQVGSLEDAIAMMSSRRFHRFLDELVELSAGGLTPETFVQVIVRTVRSAIDDPIAQRVLRDEPELLGRYLSSGALANLVEQIIGYLAPVLAAAMAVGAVRSSEPRTTAGIIVRLVLALGAVPPPDAELDPIVRAVLVPLLGPEPS